MGFLLHQAPKMKAVILIFYTSISFSSLKYLSNMRNFFDHLMNFFVYIRLYFNTNLIILKNFPNKQRLTQNEQALVVRIYISKYLLINGKIKF
ncbi:hypothetical protein CN925_06760 [Bacillus sp. AFS055030]|nr:hypothetical protein CN925_06760 [Bacillus sp. AFS055030]